VLHHEQSLRLRSAQVARTIVIDTLHGRIGDAEAPSPRGVRQSLARSPHFANQIAHPGARNMTNSGSIRSSTQQTLPWFQIRARHLTLIVFLVAIVIKDIQNQGRTEPPLITLAALGYAGYGLIGWLGWLCARRLQPRLGSMLLVSLYLTAMSAFFLLCTVTYLLVEYAYLNGYLVRLNAFLQGALWG
jgi:hypothetical protein